MGLRCQKEIMAKSKDYFAYNNFSKKKIIPSIEIEDCKQKCESDRSCISIEYNAHISECRLYDFTSLSIQPPSITYSEIYVKSCGKLTFLDSDLDNKEWKI